MTDPADTTATPSEDFDEHVEYLTGLVVEATPEDVPLRERIFNAIEALVTRVDGGEWSGCRVAWTDDIPDSPADWTDPS